MSAPAWVGDSVWVGAWPDPQDAARLAIPDGVAPGDLHATIAHLGPVARLHHLRGTLCEYLTWALPWFSPVNAWVTGAASFNGFNGVDGSGDSHVWLIDSPALDLAYRRIRDDFPAQVDRTHRWCPHITYRRGMDRDSTPVDRGAVTFTSLRLMWGEERLEVGPR